MGRSSDKVQVMYPLWERVAEILVVNERFEALTHFTRRVREAIEFITLSPDLPSEELEKLKDTLFRVQLTGVTKALALCWKPSARKFSQDFMKTLHDENITCYTYYDYDINTKHRAAWLRCRMQINPSCLFYRIFSWQRSLPGEGKRGPPFGMMI